MTLDDALKIVIARTHVVRYEHLCSEANTLPKPNDRETWRRWVIAEAERDPSMPQFIEAMPVKPCGGCP